MPDDPWAALAGPFVDGAYATVKGQVRTIVVHQQLLAHVPRRQSTVLDLGGGAGHQAFPLARLGFDVTILDPSPAMLAKAAQRLRAEPVAVRSRVRLVEGAGEDAVEVTGGEQFAVVLCHGVLMYLPQPEPMVSAVCRCVAPGGVVSILALNARTLAIRPALEGRWADALTAFDATGEVGVLGAATRGDTVEHLSGLLRRREVTPEAWYGVWLFSDRLDLPLAETDVAAVAAVEFEAGRRSPYRQLSRVFHLIGRRRSAD